MPDCTILIPTKDRPGLLHRALQSAVAALPENGEILVVDDKSTRPAAETAKTLQDERIRVVVNTGPSGAAAARNFGIGQAKGDVIFFLDDDDEMLPHYCKTILTQVLPHISSPDYGFAPVALFDDKTGQETSAQPKLPEGPITAEAPFRRKLCAFSAGFWIRRDVYRQMGPIDETLPTNEDTEYACRLIAAGKTAWYSGRAGVRQHMHDPQGEGGNLGHLTHRTHAAERARCFLTILQRYPQLTDPDPDARRHLTRRYLKLAAKSGQLAAPLAYCNGLPGFSERISAKFYTLLNYLAYTLQGRK